MIVEAVRGPFNLDPFKFLELETSVEKTVHAVRMSGNEEGMWTRADHKRIVGIGIKQEREKRTHLCYGATQ